MEIRQKEILNKWSWWNVGGLADYFCEPENPEDLHKALIWADKHQQKFTVLGGGTNVLISDEGVEGLVISLHKLKSCSVKNSSNNNPAESNSKESNPAESNSKESKSTETNLAESNSKESKPTSNNSTEFLIVDCEAGVLKSELMKIFKSYKLAPAIFLSGIPGNIGGGIVMNAGVSREFKPSEFSQIIKSFKVMTSKGSRQYQKEDIQWNYRFSSGWGKAVVYQAQFEWPLEKITDLNEKIKIEVKNRRNTQPLDRPSCGSVFKNPYPKFAGELIDKSQLKGLKIGQAQVSEKHGNFILNLGQAKAEDINNLIQKIRKTVYSKFNITLETEVCYIGRWSSENNQK